MSQTELIIYIIKLILGGLSSFLAIMLWSKTREAEWMSLLAGFVINYAGTIYSLLLDMNIIYEDKILFFGLPLTSLIFSVIPQIFFIIAFAVMLKKTRGD